MVPRGHSAGGAHRFPHRNSIQGRGAPFSLTETPSKGGAHRPVLMPSSAELSPSNPSLAAQPSPTGIPGSPANRGYGELRSSNVATPSRHQLNPPGEAQFPRSLGTLRLGDILDRLGQFPSEERPHRHAVTQQTAVVRQAVAALPRHCRLDPRRFSGLTMDPSRNRSTDRDMPHRS
eukprot:gene15714-biopygen6284